MRDMSIDHFISISDDQTQNILTMLKADIEAENPDVLSMLDLFAEELTFERLGSQLLDKLPAAAIQTIEDMKEAYYSVKSMNLKRLLGQGKVTFARDSAKDKHNTVIPFDANVDSGTADDGSEFICILIGQLNASKDFFVPNGIGRKILLIPIKNQNGDIINFSKSDSYIWEG